MYGRGVYFAQSPLYSHRYARPSAITNARFMFLAEVITGEFCQGTKDMASVPLKPGTDEVYDCAVDRQQDPNIFVVFRDANAYPLYLLKYEAE